MKNKIKAHAFYLIGIFAFSGPFLSFYWKYLMETNFWALGISALFGIMMLSFISEYFLYLRENSKYKEGSSVSFFDGNGILITGILRSNVGVLHKVEYWDRNQWRNKWVLSHQLVWANYS